MSTVKPIQGTAINLFYQDERNTYLNPRGVDCLSPDLWQVKIAEMHAMGIRYLILVAVANEGRAAYASRLMPPAYPAGRKGAVEAIVGAADELGMKVFMSCGWAFNQFDSLDRPGVRERQIEIMRETAALFGAHPSFHGWYLPCEDSIAPCLPDPVIAAVNALSAAARALTPAAKVLISPYGLFDAVLDATFAAQLAKLDVDIVAYQDEVGCVRVPHPAVRAREQFARLRDAHRRVPRIALWANVESFAWEGGQPNAHHDALVPAAFPRLLSQMAAVSPHAEEVVSFIVQGLLDPPGSRCPLGQPVWSAELARRYAEFLAGHGRWPLLAASFLGELTHDAVGCRVAPAASPGPGGGGRLTDGRLGDERATAPEWVCFDGGDLDAVVDLGAAMPIRALAARFLQHGPGGIRLPDWVDFAVSDDGRVFNPLGRVVPERWPHDRNDAWIDIAAIGDLDRRGRYVRFRAANAAGRLLVDEVMVNPRVTSAG